MFGDWNWLVIALGAVAAGMINALAGGGTLITFPLLTALGVPAVVANVTNTVALSPGYLGATLAQSKDLRDPVQRRRMMILVPVAIVSGIIGGYLLLNTGERLFRALVPYLILLASVLLMMQDRLRALVFGRAPVGERRSTHPIAMAIPVGGAAIYGGYFGAGLSVIVLAVLGLVLDDTLTRLNALKQSISFSVNTAAAIFFVFSGQVLWSYAAIMAVGAVLGGVLGGRLAGRIKPIWLRRIVVTVGFTVALIYFIRG